MGLELLKNNPMKPWAYSKDRKSLHAKFKAKDFMAAVRIIGRVAKIAEKMDHHPDIHLTNYRSLRFVLSTHSEGRVTSKDLKLAKQISRGAIYNGA